MKKILLVTLLAAALLAMPASVFAQGTDLDRAIAAGWDCRDVAGAIHCWNPGSVNVTNVVAFSLRVFDYDGTYLGTEQLWSVEVYGGQGCPQDQLLNLGAFMACHHYSR